MPSADGKLPCVVFCHCNSGSRRDAEEAVKELVPRNITVFCMDFEGSGRSEGNWVTLGANEVEDLTTVINHLRADESTSYIGLWGRSMGAVTALLYSRRDPSIAGMVGVISATREEVVSHSLESARMLALNACAP